MANCYLVRVAEPPTPEDLKFWTWLMNNPASGSGFITSHSVTNTELMKMGKVNEKLMKT